MDSVDSVLQFLLTAEARRAAVVLDTEGTVVAWNPAVVELTDVSADDAVGRPIWHLLAALAPAGVPYEQVHDGVQRVVRGMIEDHGDWRRTYEYPILSNEGTLRWLRAAVFPLRTSNRDYVSCVVCEVRSNADSCSRAAAV